MSIVFNRVERANPARPHKKEMVSRFENPAANDMLKVTIFNITSLTSGAYGKEIFGEGAYPTSYCRVPNQRTPYGNISQTFNLLIPSSK